MKARAGMFLLIALTAWIVHAATVPFTFFVAPSPGGGSPSSLVTNLTTYWKMDEASGDRADSTANAQTLTDTGVAAGTGKINNGDDFEFTASTVTLTHADSATLSLAADTDFTISAWVNLESLTGFTMPIVEKSDIFTDSNGAEYNLKINALNLFALNVGNGSANATVSASTFSTPSTGVWIFVVAWHDSAADTLNIQVNNGTVDSVSWTGGTQNGANTFSLGSSTANAGIRWDGLIDEVGFWKRTLTSGERTTLYNSGSGLSYPF